MSLVFFTDRDLGKHFPKILRDAGLEVHRHDDHFDQTTPDEEWLKFIGERRWTAITHNKRIRYTPNEVAAVMRHGVTLLVVLGKAGNSELAANFVATMPKIERFLGINTPPWIAKVYQASPAHLSKNPKAMGRISLWHPKPGEASGS